MSLATPATLHSEADALDAKAARDHRLVAHLWSSGSEHAVETARWVEARAVRTEDNAFALRIRAAEIEATQSMMREMA